jgi:hypothetical protein
VIFCGWGCVRVGFVADITISLQFSFSSLINRIRGLEIDSLTKFFSESLSPKLNCGMFSFTATKKPGGTAARALLKTVRTRFYTHSSTRFHIVPGPTNFTGNTATRAARGFSHALRAGAAGDCEHR